MAEEQTINMHYVCTRGDAVELVRNAEQFWIGDCECRSEKNDCKRSRVDVCLMFRAPTSPDSTFRQKTRADAEAILKEAEQKHLVCRPFRDDSRTKTEGSCFCCDCCCGYFREDEYSCDKGRHIEKTDTELCTDCGECVEVCYFKARTMEGDRLKVERDNCFGCGLCLDVCPVECIEMEER